jgi:RNA polymerase sigma factor (sigma-70 family)
MATPTAGAPAGRPANLLRHLTHLLQPAGNALQTDGQLLERFAATRDEAAFATLVQRHGALVLGVCRRLLGDAHEAEDVFQATFLVLANKAAGIHRREAVAGFLHGVAVRLARKALMQRARLRTPDLRAVTQPADIPAAVARDELRRVVDEELRRLPVHYRVPLVLCYLEGKSRRQAAAELGCSEGSIKGKLERGRELLRARLLRRGVALAPLALGALDSPAGAAVVPAAWTAAAVRAAISAPAISGPAAVLARAMLLGGKPKAVAAILVLCAAVGVGLGMLARPSPAEQTSNDLRATRHTDSRGGPVAAGRGAGHIPGEVPIFCLGLSRAIRQSITSPPGFTTYCATCHVEPVDARRFAGLQQDGNAAIAGALGHAAPTVMPSAVCAALTTDGRTMAVVGTDNCLRLWDVAAGRTTPKASVALETRVLGLAFTPDGKQLAVYDAAGVVQLRDTATARESRGFPVAATLSCGSAEAIAFSPDGKTLAVSANALLGLWQVATGMQRCRIQEKMPGSLAVAFTPDGRALAFAAADGTVRLVDTVTGAAVASLGNAASHRQLVALAVSADGKTLAARSCDHVVRLWDLGACRELSLPSPMPVALEAPGRHGSSWMTCLPPAASLAFSADGRFLAAADAPGRGHLWELATSKELRPGGDRVMVDLDSGSGSLRLSPDGSRLAVVLPVGDSTASPMVCVWDVLTGRPSCCVQPSRTITAPPALSPDGRILALAHGDRCVSLWEATSGAPRCMLTSGKSTPLTRLGFAPDGKVLAGGDGREVLFWDLQSCMELTTRRGDSLDLVSLVVTADGRTPLSAASDTTALVWDVAAVRPEDDVAGSAVRARAALRRLQSVPRQVVRLLRRALAPGQP